MIVCNVGGTKTEFASVKDGSIVDLTVVDTKSFEDASSLVRQLLSGSNSKDVRIAVAGPVSENRSSLTNVALSFDGQAIQHEFGLENCQIVNDIVAVGLAVQKADASPARKQTNRGRRHLVLNIGTGLGGALIHGSSAREVIGLEPGRLSIKVLHQVDDELCRCLGEADWTEVEDVLSGPGLSRLYQAFARRFDKEISPKEVFEYFDAGDATAKRVVEVFWLCLAEVCAEISSVLAPVRSITFTGGVILKNQGNWKSSDFSDFFSSSTNTRQNAFDVDFGIVGFENPELIGLSVISDDFFPG